MNLSALKSPNYRLYYSGAVAAVFSLWVYQIVIMWLAWDLTGSASFVGLAGAVTIAPTILIGPIFGAIADRVPIIKMGFIVHSGVVLCYLSLTVLQFLGLLTPAILLVLTFFYGLVKSAYHPVRLSLAPRLVDPKLVGSVTALASLNFNISRVIAPVVAGFVIDAYGIIWAMGLTFIFSLPNLAIYPFLTPRPNPKHNTKETVVQSLVIGLKYVLNHRTVRFILGVSLLFSLSIRGVLEVLPIIADGVFEKGATGVGTLGSFVGVGAIVAGLVKSLGQAETTSRVSPTSWFACFLGIAAVIGFGNIPNWNGTLAMAALLGFSSTMLGISMQTAIQLELPDNMRGRVMSFWILVGIGGAAFGSLAFGVLTDMLNFGVATIAVGATSFLIIVVMVGLYNRRQT